MPQGIGYTFQPGADSQLPNQQGGGQSASGLSPQAAVKLLQLRVPERPAASALAPQGLLNGQGGQGFGGGGLQAIIQMLMRGFGGQGGQGGGQGLAGGLPQPRVVPGINPRGPVDPGQLVDTTMPDRDQIERLLDMDLGGGQTLRTGGGIIGNWRGRVTPGQNPIQPMDTQAPPLF